MTKKSSTTRVPKILIYDIETSHSVVATFSLFKPIIPIDNILQDWFMICAAWKWHGKDKIYGTSLLGDKARYKKCHTDDYHVVKSLHKVLSEADAIVAHNGDRFDIKKFNARAIKHGLKPIPPPVQIDTLKIARNEFAFTSNKLDYLGEFLGVGRKIHTNNQLWLDCLAGKRSAVREMFLYNKQDVVLLEKVYDILAPFAKTSKLNRNLFTQEVVCTNCGGHNLHKRGERRTLTRVFKRYQCVDCGKWNSSSMSADLIRKVGFK